MFLPLALAATLIGSGSAQFDNMDDSDFEKFLQIHDDVGARYGETAAKGCVTGAVGGSTGGFQALCIGCTLGAAGNVAQEMIFPEEKKRNE